MSRQIAFAQTAMGQCFIHKYRENHDVGCPQNVFCAAHELFGKEELDTPSFAGVGGSQLDEIDNTLGSQFGPSSTRSADAAMLLAAKNEGDILRKPFSVNPYFAVTKCLRTGRRTWWWVER